MRKVGSENKPGKRNSWCYHRAGLVYRGIIFMAILSISLNFMYASIPPYVTVDKKIREGALPVPYQSMNTGEARERGINAGRIYPSGKQPHRMPRLSAGGSFNALAILIQFSDKPSSVNSVYFDSLLFSNDGSTLRRYYREISYDRMDIVTVNLPSTIGWSTVPQTYEYYAAGQNGFGAYPRNAQKMVEDAVMLADSTVDFSRYDNDGDGFVDALFIIHAGTGAEFTGSPDDIWSHQWSTYMPLSVDGVTIFAYSTEPEYWVSAGDMTCGVYAHEMGHAVFGLPDLYDYGNDSRGLGRWSLMATGSWNGYLGNSPAHPDPWSLIQMGFLSPTVLTDNIATASLGAVEDTGIVLKYVAPESNGNEYFLIENRQKTGFDKQLRGNGLLIYHVDESQIDNSNQWYPGIEDGQHYKVAIEQADGKWDLEKNQNAGDASDPFPGTSAVTTFSAGTLPGSIYYSGTPSSLRIENIREVAGAILSSISIHPPAPRIIVDRSVLEVTLTAEDSTLQTLTIYNSGSAVLHYSIVSDSFPGCIHCFPLTGYLLPDSVGKITIHISAIGVQPGAYTTALHFITNDSLNNPLDVSLSVFVGEIPSPPLVIFTWASGWNLVSNPVSETVSLMPEALPDVISNMYDYTPNIGYTQSSNFVGGRGYWVKLDSANTVGISENLLDSLTIDVSAGWNLIGSIARQLPIDQIVTVPAGNLMSDYFTFQEGYCRADTLYPGRGYWVKMKEAGRLVLKSGIGNCGMLLSSSFIPDSANGMTLLFMDANTHTQLLHIRTDERDSQTGWYDLPPVPPQEVFDVRFTKSGSAQTQYIESSPDGITELPISISGISYPLTISWHGDAIGGRRYTLIEVTDGERGKVHELLESTPVVLSNPRITSLLLYSEPVRSVPDAYSLEQNYPNPFNPTTMIRFGLSADAFVTVIIYNEIGQEISRLLNHVEYPAGFHEIEFNAGDISAGVYMYRMAIEEKQEQFVTPSSMRHVYTRKMLLLK